MKYNGLCLEINYDKFRTEILSGDSKHLDIRLCYELSLACVGVKRQSQVASYTICLLKSI